MLPLTRNVDTIANCEGLIFFAERTRELLLHTTNDSYKVNAHHTASRVRELISLANHCIQHGVAINPLGDLIGELEFSVMKDPIVGRVGIKPELNELVGGIVSELERPDARSGQVLLRNLLAIELLLCSYGEKIKSRINELIDKDKEKKELSVLAELFIIECQQKGYTREYIRYASKSALAKKIAYGRDVDPKKVVNNYFEYFQGKRSEYVCVTTCRGVLSEVVAEAFELKITESFDEVGLKDHKYMDLLAGTCHLGKLGEKEKYLTARFKVLDPYVARESFYGKLRMVGAIRQYIEHENHFFYGQVCVIRDVDRGKEIRTNEPINVMFRSLSGSKASREDNDEKELRFNRGVLKLAPASRKSVVSALTFHREALNAQAQENKLIDLWAALEGFLPQSKEGGNRISAVVSHLVPILSLKYASKKFYYVYRLILNAKVSLSEILAEVKVEGSEFEKFCAIVTCTELVPIAKKILGSLGSQPLLRYRMWLLHEQFRTAEKIHDEITRHQKKIEWHMRRIYVARNTVMHSATTYSDLGVLVENLHTYLDSIIDAVLIMASHASRETSIDAALRAILAIHHSHMAYLKGQGGKAVSVEDYSDFLFGRNNRLAVSSAVD